MNAYTRTFLVLLRLAIGWHLLVEGFDKVHSHYVGPTETSKPWSSEAYLRGASGPLAPYFRSIPGDPDEQLLARLASQPAAIFADWDSYVAQFKQHYGLDAEQQKKTQALLIEQKALTTTWFATEKKSIKKSFPSGLADVPMTVSERVTEYKAKLTAVREAEDRLLPSFGKDVMKQKLASLKAEVARVRNELNQDIEDQTKRMKTELAKVLTPEQKKKSALEDQPPERPFMQRTADFCTMWGLVVAGICLLLGIFTRTACWIGVSLLLLFYGAAPALPWLPESPRSEGHYIFVNKNIIEALALMALGTLRTGRWFGLDGLLCAFFRCGANTKLAMHSSSVVSDAAK